MKSRALGREISRAFFEGDNLADPDEPAGLRQVIPSSQVYVAGTNGAPLTPAMLDEALDLVVPGNVHIFMGPLNRRKLTAAMLAGGAAATYQITYGGVDAMGEQTDRYGGAPIHIIRDRGTGTGILGFDETCGTSNITSSIYIVNFDQDCVFGIYNGDGPPGRRARPRRGPGQPWRARADRVLLELRAEAPQGRRSHSWTHGCVVTAA